VWQKRNFFSLFVAVFLLLWFLALSSIKATSRVNDTFKIKQKKRTMRTVSSMAEHLNKGSLSDSQFVPFDDCVRTLSSSGLVFEEIAEESL